MSLWGGQALRLRAGHQVDAAALAAAVRRQHGRHLSQQVLNVLPTEVALHRPPRRKRGGWVAAAAGLLQQQVGSQGSS